MLIRSLREISVAQLKKATALKARIEQLETKLTSLLGIPEAVTLGGTRRRHRRMSAAAKAKISAAAKARWAKIKSKKNGR
jgi:hypothetical protein